MYSHPKLRLIHKSEQNRKTFEVIKIIENSGDGVMHVILTTNNLSCNAQFMHRVSHMKSSKYIVAVISSKKLINTGTNEDGCETVHHKNIREFMGSIMTGESKLPKVVLLCCNPKQIDAVCSLSKSIPTFDRVLTLNIYIDEFHKNCLAKTKRLIKEIIVFDHVSCIYGSSATCARILEEDGLFQSVELLTPSNCDMENYVGLDDLNIKFVENESKSKKGATKLFEYIKQVYDENPHLLSDKKIGFVPGHSAKSSHNTIMKHVQMLNENVVVIMDNSDQKCISYIENGQEVRKNIHLTDSEMCHSISSLLNTHNLMNRPIVFTGYTCINIAATLVNEDIGTFDYAIIAHKTQDSSTISQLLGRLYGHQKHWVKYRVTDVYCSDETYKKAKKEYDHHKKIKDENYSVPLTQPNYYSSNTIEHDTDGEIGDTNVPKVDDRVYILFNTAKEAVDFVNKAVFNKLYLFAKHVVSDNTFNQGKSAKTLSGTGTNLTIDELLQQYSKLKTRNGVVRKSVVIHDSKTRWVVYWEYKDLVDSIKDNHIHDRSNKIKQYILNNGYIVEGPGAAYYHDDDYTRRISNDADEKEVRDEPGVGEMKHGSSEPPAPQDYEHLLPDEIAESKNTTQVNVEEKVYECEPESPAGQAIAVEDNSNTNLNDDKCIII